MDGDIEHCCAEEGHEGSQEFGMRVMALRDEISRADIQEESAKDGQDDSEDAFRQGEEHRRDDAEDGRNGIYGQPAERAVALAVILQDEVDGIDTVRKVVCQDRDSDHCADRSRDLECQADGHAVEEAVDGEARCAERAAAHVRRLRCREVVLVPLIMGMRMQEDEPIEDEVGQEPESDDGRDESGRIIVPAEIEGLGHKVEEGHCDDRPGAEAEDEVEAVFEPQSGQTSQHRGHECPRSDEYERDHGSDSSMFVRRAATKASESLPHVKTAPFGAVLWDEQAVCSDSRPTGATGTGGRAHLSSDTLSPHCSHLRSHSWTPCWSESSAWRAEWASTQCLLQEQG